MNDLISVIGGVIILILIVVAIVIRFKVMPKEIDREKATEFLEGLKDVFYNKMMSIVINFDVSEYDSIEEFEAATLKTIYDELWEYVSKELEEVATTDILTAMALKVLNKDFIESFITKLIERYQIEERINGIWISNKEQAITDEDNRLAEEFSNQKEYVEEFDNSDLNEAEIQQPTQEELDSLNPPVDEEKEYDPESDSSVEIIDETVVDGNGRLHSKTSGRFV